MGLFYDFFSTYKKKRCTECGCIMHSDSESDLCECCIDEMYRDEDE